MITAVKSGSVIQGYLLLNDCEMAQYFETKLTVT